MFEIFLCKSLLNSAALCFPGPRITYAAPFSPLAVTATSLANLLVCSGPQQWWSWLFPGVWGLGVRLSVQESSWGNARREANEAFPLFRVLEALLYIFTPCSLNGIIEGPTKLPHTKQGAKWFCSPGCGAQTNRSQCASIFFLIK